MVMACAHAVAVEPAEPVRKRFLLLDSRIIEKADAAKLTVGTVVKHAKNPLFVEDKPWEPRYDNLYANVIYDEQEKLYKCWYSPFIVDPGSSKIPAGERAKRRYPEGRMGRREMGVCYATSPDGLTWTKPMLDVVPWKGGKSNIVVRGPHGTGVFKDLREKDPTRRYKMFFKGRRISVAFSGDGIRWGKAIECPEANVAGDTHNNAFWAPTLGRYVGITRTWGGRPRRRQLAWTSSADFVKWTPAKVVHQGADPGFQTYAMPTFFHGGVYVGLVMVHNIKADRVQCELAWSGDTVKWHRVDEGTPLIANSAKKGAYDWGCVYAAATPVFTDKGIRLYYGGSDGLHYGWRNGSFALATLRSDGFAGYEPSADNGKAVITTRGVTCTGPTLRLCADVSPGGSITTTVINADRPEDSRPLATGKAITQTVTDGPVTLVGGNLSVGGKVALQFVVRKAKLYSFSFGQ